MTAESRPKCPVGRLPVSVSKIPGGGNLRRVKPINRNLVTTATASLRGAVFRASAKNGTFSLGEEAFDFFLLLSLAKPTLPSADTTFSEGGGGFSNYQRHRYYPSTDAPPFSLLPSPFPSLEGGVNPSLSLSLFSSRHGFHKAVCTLAEREGGNKRHRNIKRGCAIAIIGAASSLLSVLKTS